jgi:hypothetical protein
VAAFHSSGVRSENSAMHHSTPAGTHKHGQHEHSDNTLAAYLQHGTAQHTRKQACSFTAVYT